MKSRPLTSWLAEAAVWRYRPAVRQQPGRMPIARPGNVHSGSVALCTNLFGAPHDNHWHGRHPKQASCYGGTRGTVWHVQHRKQPVSVRAAGLPEVEAGQHPKRLGASCSWWGAHAAMKLASHAPRHAAQTRRKPANAPINAGKYGIATRLD